MKSSNRDLLVLSKKSTTSKQEMDMEVEKLHQILFSVESLDNFCVVNEVIDINKYKIYDTPDKIQKVLSKKLKPFQFINNKN